MEIYILLHLYSGSLTYSYYKVVVIFLSTLPAQDSAQFPHPVAVVHHSIPLFAIEVHLLYLIPPYVKGKVQVSPFVVRVKHP